ncbi:MAG: tetratricopeptide repeat protein [Chitinispirillaceae bacterium]|nr:tetratricopeptide repeat protein [Chitinispirillaceae bacterium]
MDEWLDAGDLIDKTEDLIEFGLHDEALDLLNRYFPLYEDVWELYVLYGRLYTDRNQPDTAIDWLRRGLAIEKNSVDCLLGLFYAYSLKHQVKRGGKYLLLAVRQHPDNEMVLTALIWYYTEINDLSAAIGCFEQLQRKGADNPEMFRNGGIAYQRSGNYDDAERCFKIALELNKQFDEVRDMLADLYLFLELEKKAIQLYQDALRESPRNIRILSRLIFCHTQANDMEQAASLAKESIRLYPNSPIGYVDLSYVHLNNNNPAEAVACADRAHDISPFDAEAFRIKGIAWTEMSEWEKGKAAFETAIGIEPDNSEILRDYYHHLRSSGDFAGMEKVVHQVIKLEYPFCVEDYWFLTDYYRESGDILKAFHYLNKAYKSMPSETELIPPMVDILLEQGHTSYAIPFLFRYVYSTGWNDTLNEFARHRRFKEKWAQEGFRFLRFQGQRPKEFRQYLFRHYMRRFLIVLITVLAVVSLFPGMLLFGTKALIATVSGYAAFLSFIFIRQYIHSRKKVLPDAG